MKISVRIDSAAAQAQLRQWGGEFRQKVKKSVAQSISSEAIELKQDVRSHVAGQMTVVKKSFLKEGKTLPVDADVSTAQEALDKLKACAQESSQIELKVATDKAQAAISNVQSLIEALNRIQTASKHQVTANVDAARPDIQSLDELNTSNTHTVYMRAGSRKTPRAGWWAQTFLQEDRALVTSPMVARWRFHI